MRGTTHSLSSLMRFLMSVQLVVGYIAFLPMIRLTGFGRHRPLVKGISTSSIVLAGSRYMEPLFAIVNSSIRIPIACRHEREVATALSQIRGRVFLDVGANYGYYCCLLQGNFDQMIAVEPEQANIRMMRRVFGLRGVRPLILANAVSDHDGFANLILSPSRSGHRIAPSETEEGYSEESTRVRTITIESLVRKYGEIDLAKVDVEGAEWLVLSGAGKSVDLVRRWAI